MAQIVLGLAGAAVGFAVGQPGLGFTIGYGLGASLFPPKVGTIRQGQQPLSDLKVSGTEYGQPIPYVRGAAGIAGQLWWNSDKRAITTVTTSGGGGGGKGGGGGGSPVVETTTITYEIDLLIGLSDNEIVGISRIWDNGKLVYTASSEASGGSIAASAVAGLWDRMTVYTGDAAQLPDPTYEAAVGTANAPAYRGRGSVFIQGLKLGQSGQLRNLTFEVVVDGSISSGGEVDELFTSTGVNDQYIANSDTEYAGLALSNKIWVNRYDGADHIALLDLETQSVLFAIATSGFPGMINAFPSGLHPDGSGLFHMPSLSRIYKVDPDGTYDYIGGTAGGGGYGIRVDNLGNYWITDNFGGGVISRLSDIDFGSHTCTKTDVAGGGFSRFLRNATAIPGRVYGVFSGISQHIGYVDTGSMTIVDVITPAAVYSQVPPPVIGADQNIYTIENVTLKKYSKDGALLGSVGIADGNGGQVELYDALGKLWVRGTTNLYKIDAATLAIEQTIPRASIPTYGQFIAEATAGIPVIQGSHAGFAAIGVITLAGLVTISPPDVSDVVEAICLRAGLSAGQIDVTGLSGITRKVRSLALSQIAAPRQALELLASAFFFESTVSDKIYFRTRGGSAAATIPYIDLGATLGDDQPDPLALKQANELEIPAQIALTYINISDDYQSDTQMSDRLVSAEPGSVSAVSMAIGLTPSEAKAIADTMLFDQAASVISTNISLLGDYCALEPTDPIIATAADGSTFRLRLVKKTDSFPLITFEAVLDDVSVLTQQGITSADYTPGTVVADPIDTLMELLDIPILQDGDNDAGFYVAAKGDGTPWNGAGIYGSIDDVTFDRRATVLENAVFGDCLTTLGDWTGPRVFDETNTVTVDVGDGTLATNTRDAVLGSQTINAIVIGSELLQFRNATLISPGIYELSGLLRGSRGTEWAMTGHAAGERCVALTVAGIRRIQMQNSELGVTRYFKGVTLGRAVSTADSEAFVDYGIGLKPFSPFDFRVSRDASNNCTLSWQRRTRFSTRVIGPLGISIPLGEDSERYDVEIYSDGTYATLVRTINAITTATTYTAAEQVADGLTPGNQIFARIFQRSAVVGRGYKLEATA